MRFEKQKKGKEGKHDWIKRRKESVSSSAWITWVCVSNSQDHQDDSQGTALEGSAAVWRSNRPGADTVKHWQPDSGHQRTHLAPHSSLLSPRHCSKSAWVCPGGFSQVTWWCSPLTLCSSRPNLNDIDLQTGTKQDKAVNTLKRLKTFENNIHTELAYHRPINRVK